MSAAVGRSARRFSARRTAVTILIAVVAALAQLPARAGEQLLRPARLVQVSEAQRSLPVPTRSDHRQMWVWHPDDPAGLVALARRSRVDVLLVWVSPGFTHDHVVMSRLRLLQALADDRGIVLRALSGDPSWLRHPAVADRWAREVRASGLFTGLHLDIEPHALPEWHRKRQRLAQELLAVLDSLRHIGMAIEADIPAWYYTIRVDGTTLDEAVLRRVSGVTVMAYQDNAERVLTAARPEITAAANMGKSAYVGVNLGPTGGDAPTTTMLGLGASTIIENLARIDRVGSRWPGFSGLALHDAQYVGRLLNRP